MHTKILKMKTTLHNAWYQMKHYMGLVWFKIALLVILGVVMNRKDVSFTFNFNAGQETNTMSSPLAVNETGKFTEAARQEMGVFADMIPRPSPAPLPRRTPEQIARFKKQQTYVDRFSAVAVSEMKKYGIPASITLAQGVVETNSGASTLASKHNNHFGIKCFSKKCGKGHCVNFTDNTHKDFFVRYESAWASYRAHSEFLNGKRYRHLQNMGSDYKAWAKGLKEAGYATDPSYDIKLIRTIEDLELYKYDE